jgi:hypothetical protein
VRVVGLQEITSHQSTIAEATASLEDIQQRDDSVVTQLKSKKKEFAVLHRESQSCERVRNQPCLSLGGGIYVLCRADTNVCMRLILF